MDGIRWIGRKVFLKTFSGRTYQGKVIYENTTHLTLIDIKSCSVEISKLDIKFCQEER